MIAQELEVSLHMAFVEARQQRHEFITVEHLLLALLDNPSAAEVLRACSANIDDLRKSLSNFIADNTPQVSGTEEVDTQPTLGFQRVIQRAIMHVQSTGSGKKEVTGANVLVAIFGEKDSHAVYYLHQQGVTRLDVVNFIAHGIKKSDPPEPAKPAEGSAGSASNESEKDDGGVDAERQREEQRRIERGQHDQERDCAAIERARDERRHHASTARPLRANMPRGRFWMNRMISTRIAILPSTAPANGSRNLLAMPSERAPTRVPHRLPTPPNTTTMKLSMM